MSLSRAGMMPEALAATKPDWLNRLRGDWGTFAHAHQCEPALAHNGRAWTTWLMLGGRGAGKTRAGAEWVRAIAQASPRGAEPPRIALVGETEHDVREVMIEGVSGLLAAHAPHERPQWVATRGRLEWANGAVAQAFSADVPDSLRGPQFSHAWCDELAKWKRANAAFDMLQFALRLGARPRQLVTTTPRPIGLIKRLLADPSCVVTHAGTRVNACNLAPSFVATVMDRYGGTRLGRQEIDGLLVEERADALWSRGLVETCRVDAEAAAGMTFERIVVAVDPPASGGKRADACGLVAAGRADNGTIYVLADETAAGLSPQGWARKAIALWRRLEADALVADVRAAALAMAMRAKENAESLT
jgi:phage terminase large subunit-like protein